MTKELVDSFLKALSGLSALAVALGYLIVNYFLGNYMINDYSLFSARAIQAGVVYMLFVGASVIIVFAFIETRHCEKVSLSKMLINFTIKPILLTNFFFTRFAVEGFFAESYSICSFLISDRVLHALMSLSFVGFMMRTAGYIYIKQTGDKLGVLFDKPSLFLMGISSLAFPVMVWNNDTYQEIFMFFSSISLICCSVFAIMVDSAHGLKTVTSVEPSLFTADTAIQPPSKLEHLWLIVYLSVMLLGNAGIYSWSLYPNLAEKYGGGRPLPVMIVTNNDEKIHGKLIHRDANSYYMLGKDNRIIRLVQTATIKSIQME